MSAYMQQALALAAKGQYLTSPNPSIGCVLVDAAGLVIGQGHTQKAGEAHAEIMAMRDAAQNGHLAGSKLTTGCVAYVTLEPCNHQGRTGPCSLALVQSGVAKVVAANLDPNPLVAGQGFETLRQAGIHVEVLDSNHELAIAARESYIGFWQRMTTGLPWVRMKAAASLDGITALANGNSQWITGEAARADGHAWRARACAILTGIGTVLADDPSLDVRYVSTSRQPTLVLVDSHLDVPLTAKIFGKDRKVWIYAATANAEKVQALNALGAEIIYLPDANGKVDLAAMLLDLGKRQVNELHVEAGFKLNGSLWRSGLVDELLLYQSAQLMGLGQGIAHIGPFEQLDQTPKLRYHSTAQIGGDLRILARKI